MKGLLSVLSLAKFYYAQRVKGFSVPQEPHFDPASTPEFTRLLGKARFYLEYGSGGSTLLAARLKVRSVSVESDRYFARAVERALPAEADDRMIFVDIGITQHWGAPLFTRRTPNRIERWARYPKAPFDGAIGEQEFPDLVLVDGRFRVACALEVTRQAQRRHMTTTICLDDYLGRPYTHLEKYLGLPRMVGRMAIFQVTDATLPVPEAAISSASEDFS
jgi:hypothetical protein